MAAYHRGTSCSGPSAERDETGGAATARPAVTRDGIQEVRQCTAATLQSHWWNTHTHKARANPATPTWHTQRPGVSDWHIVIGCMCEWGAAICWPRQVQKVNIQRTQEETACRDGLVNTLDDIITVLDAAGVRCAPSMQDPPLSCLAHSTALLPTFSTFYLYNQLS